MSKLVNISEVCKILGLIDPYTKKPLNHIIRYWEKEFSQIKPKKINNRRYYSQKDLETIKFIKMLIKDKKIRIEGVKNILRSNVKKLDGQDVDKLKMTFLRTSLKNKSKKLLDKILELKHYGKKNSS